MARSVSTPIGMYCASAAGELAMLSLDARVLDNWRALGLPEALPRAG